MGLFFRIFQHLLPRSIAWRLRSVRSTWRWDDGHRWDDTGLLWDSVVSAGRTIDRFFEGLSIGFEAARTFVDRVWQDAFPSTTRELPAFETQFGILPLGTTSDRVAQLGATWQETGGQSPRYLQDQIQAAGFDLYLHEWWVEPGDVVRDPRQHTVTALFGQWRCGMPGARCISTGTVRCTRFLVNDIGYLVNSNSIPLAPPSLPGDDTTGAWRHFIYWGPSVLDNPPTVPKAEVLASRRAELERRLLKICPAHAWLILYVDFVDEISGDS